MKEARIIGDERLSLGALPKVVELVESGDRKRVQYPRGKVERKIQLSLIFRPQGLFYFFRQLVAPRVMAAHQYAPAERAAPRQTINPRHSVAVVPLSALQQS